MHDVKWRDERKRYKRYRARKEQLPASYREAIDAVERYALRFGPAAGETVLTMLEDLAGSFEQGAKAGVPVSEIVGEYPVGFTDGFLAGYPGQPVGRQGAAAPGPHHRRRGASGGPDQMTDHVQTPAIPGRGWRSRSRTCTSCAASISRSHGAASSPCSVPTVRARPRSCGSC